MTLDVRINNQSLRDILTGPPKIGDQVDAICRTLTLPVVSADALYNQLGQPIELWQGGKRLFYGVLRRRGFDAKGNVAYTAYDPLFFFKKHTDDWYFKNVTGNQIFTLMCQKVGVKVGKIEATAGVFKQLHYQGAPADKVAVDVLARTIRNTGKKYWYRFDPDVSSFGFTLFERKVPSKIWAFQAGINLEGATLEESIEDTFTVVKLVNRETGKVVQKVNTEAMKKFGQTVHFAEVDKDQAKTMDKRAEELLKDLSKVKVTMEVQGINPNNSMPQFFSGDVIYVEEETTGMIGAYHIRNITQIFENDRLVKLDMDVQEAPEIPKIEYEKAADPIDSKKKETKKKTKAAAAKKSEGVNLDAIKGWG